MYYTVELMNAEDFVARVDEDCRQERLKNEKIKTNIPMTTPDSAEAVNVPQAVYDCNGREIMPGDTLKVFHFIGPRRKRYFMYKYVEAIEARPSWNGKTALLISHLNTEKQTYLKMCDGSTWDECEIVQGYRPDGKPFDERPRLTTKTRTN